MNQSIKNMSLLGLVALIVTTIVGGGIFNIPSDIARHSGIASIMIGWFITGIGMLCLALLFQNLSHKKKDLNAGIYSYTKDGFGPLLGFTSAWGYWTSAFVGNIAYLLMLFETLSYFFPIFNSPLYTFIGASLIIWGLYFLIASGLREVSIINVIITCAKLIPLLFFVIVMCFFLKLDNLKLDFWGNKVNGSLLEQVKQTMLVTVWVFIGIEGAIVVSSRAKRRKDIGLATVIGFLSTMFLYIFITFITLSAIPRDIVIKMPNPSLVYALEFVLGKYGACIMIVGLIISIVGALLGWTILAIEIPFTAACDKTMPKIFSKKNSKGTPIFSLLFTTLCVHIFIGISLFFSKNYQSMYFVASAAILIPYALSALYNLKLILVSKIKAVEIISKDLIVTIIACLYSTWLIFAALEPLLLCSIIYTVGLFIFIIEKWRNKEKIFTCLEFIVASVIIITALVSLVLFSKNLIHLQ